MTLDSKIKFTNNPFVTGQPVYGDNFIDRHDILLKVEHFIQSKINYSFLVFGQRRIGKTSLLRHIDKTIAKSNSAIACYFNIQNVVGESVEKIIKEITDQVSADFRIKQVPEVTNAAKFGEFLVNFAQSTNQTYILLFDEFDSVLNLENAKSAYIKNFYDFFYESIKIVAEAKISVKFIFALAPSFKSIENVYYTKLLSYGKKVNLNFFQPIRLTELLKLSEPNVYFSEAAEKLMFYLTAGHPLFSQCLAAACFKNAVSTNTKNVDRSEVKPAFHAAIKSYSSNIFWIWESLLYAHKIVLFSILHLRKEKQLTDFYSIFKQINSFKWSITEKELSLTLEQLYKYHYLKQIMGKYYFKSKFFMVWIQKFVEKEKIN